MDIYRIEKRGDTILIVCEDGGFVTAEKMSNGHWHVIDMVEEWYAESFDEILDVIFA